MRRAAARGLGGVLAVLAMGGCGAGGPDEAEFRAAIDQHLAETPKCIGDVAWRLPADVRREHDPALEPHHAAMLARLDALVELGLVRATPVPDAAWGRPMSYELTEAGKRFYREFPAGRWDPRKPVGAFCYGTPGVDSILRYTEPTETTGETQTEVTYTYMLREVANWARDPILRRLDPTLDREIGGRSPEARAILVKTSDGWRVAARS